MTIYTDIFFPECITYGSEMLPTYDTLKVEVLSGAEQRSTRQAYVKNKYNITIENMPAPELQEIINIFHVCAGDLIAFLFKDATDNTSSNTAASVSGSTITGDDQFQGTYDAGIPFYPLFKTYAIASRSRQRRIRHPVVSSLIVHINGGLNTDWTWNTTEQALEWAGVEPTDTDIISAGYEYHIPVRFDIGEMGIEPVHGLAESMIANLNNIALLEVFE